METPREWIDAGAWVGRQQAFAMIANSCSAAQALCLKQVRETRLYEKIELSWEEFCKEYAGISRSQADRLIQQYEEFGDAYFRLSEIARISPETYRQIASQVSDEGLEFDGRKLALIPENGPKIRAAIQTLRAQLQQASDASQPASPGITQLLIRMDALLEEVATMGRRLLDASERAGLQGLGFSLGVAANQLPNLRQSSTNAWHSLRMRGGMRAQWWRGLQLLLLTILTNALRRSEDIVLAAEARAFRPDCSRAAPLRIGRLDWWLIPVGVMSLVGAILLA